MICVNVNAIYSNMRDVCIVSREIYNLSKSYDEYTLDQMSINSSSGNIETADTSLQSRDYNINATIRVDKDIDDYYNEPYAGIVTKKLEDILKNPILYSIHEQVIFDNNNLDNIKE
jgi:hypothetical protein